MMPVKIVLLAASVVLGAQASADAQTFGSPTHFTEQGGAAIYAGVCAACHMPSGLGAEGAASYPSLSHNARLETPAYPIFMILRGQGAMPSFARTLSDRQIADVVAFIETHFGNADTDLPTPLEVKAARTTN
jgi:mono/diheme cytochrome c family protein